MWDNDPANFAPGCPDSSGVIERFACIRLGPLGTPARDWLYYPTNHGNRGVLSVRVDKTGSGVTALRYLVVTVDWNANVPEGYEEVAGGSEVRVDPTLRRMGLADCGCSGGATESRFVLTSDEPVVSGGTTYPPGADLPPEGSWADPDYDNVWFTMTSRIKPIAAVS